MDQGIISRRYASALWMYAKKNGQEDRVYAETKRLRSGFSNYASLKRVLSNRMLPQQKKTAVVTMIAGEMAGESVSESFTRFVRLVFANKREEFLRTICLSYETIYLRESKILPANLVTAAPMEKDMEQRFIERIEARTGHTVRLQTKVNPNIVGGYVITLDTYRLDASVTAQLKRIKESLLETPIHF